jgi:ectoine hydroxylase-related dioxygenase (phytanoyl-CoA dioxygenase family)
VADEGVADRGAALDESQVATFAAEGWLSLQAVTSATELEWLRGVYDELFAARAGEAAGEFFDLAAAPGASGRELLPQIMEPQTKVPELGQTRFAAAARLIAARLLGAGQDELSHFSHMILKPAGYGRETPWHQDEAYWDPGFDYDSVSVWMPLDDATAESGCMRFIPRSHRGPVRSHRHIDDDPQVRGLVTDDVDELQAVACPLSPGRACVHHSRMVHYAGPNRTDQPRRAYIHVFSVAPRRRAEPYPRPWLGDRPTVSPGLPA